MYQTIEGRNIAVIYSAVNKPPKKADATGAFIPEAKNFQEHHGVPDENMFGFDWRKNARLRRTMAENHICDCAKKQPLDAIAFFCHGWPNGIQAGFTRDHIGALVNVIANCSRDYLEIVIYACLTAENDTRDNQIKNIGPATEGGFADVLSRKLGDAGIAGHVDAHKVAGHTTWVPKVIRFTNLFRKNRAAWLVEPGSESWPYWTKAMRNTDMKYRFPFMGELQIKNELHYTRGVDMLNEAHYQKMYDEICEKLDKLESIDEDDPAFDKDHLYSMRGMAKFLEDVLDLPRRKPKTLVPE